MTKVRQIAINYFKDSGDVQIKANGWKLGEEKLLIGILGEAAKYFNSPRFRKTIIDAIHKQIDLGKRGRGDRPPFHYE